MSQSKRTLLIVDDDPGIRQQLKWQFDSEEVHTAGDQKEALAALRRHEPQVVLLDLGLPPDVAGVSEGMAILAQILRLAPATKVIIVSAHDERENALAAVERGAYDFLEKPIDTKALQIIVDRAHRLYELEEENRRLVRLQAGELLEGVIGASPAMAEACRMVAKVAPMEATVLLLGESGTGKELLARALHKRSPRSQAAFVAINCASIPENLLESELFGYERGAFTGAVQAKPGRIELAQGGTLFLDEIGDLPLSLQAKLLRFIQERVIERVGGKTSIPIDVRIVCATNRDLAEMMAEGAFREDLYYRLNEVVIKIPPLRDRSGDALLLARVFLDRYSKQTGRKVVGFTDDAAQAIEAYTWPGNVRELENKIKRAVIMAETRHLGVSDLSLGASDESRDVLNLRQVRESAEREAVVAALARAQHNLSKAAEFLGISRPTLYDLLDKHKLR